ncbi:hypothetical protein [Knoellia sp. CPCC 206391]|uniref:hypothetical protein n=1 Tax=Knoellia altitudinis TaxID=3404795 RepID=UPI003B42B719
MDHSSKHVPGLFPLSVERVFNQVVAEHALAVTTVTAGARYYALHGLVAHEATKKDLEQETARNLLRRCEVAIALATLAHHDSDEHDWDRGVSPHAAERLRPLWRQGPINLPAIAQDGEGTYIKNKWGVLGSTYRGAEMTMKILEPSGLTPGPGYDDAAVRPALRDIFDLAALEHVSDGAALEYGHLCLCRASTDTDSGWLRRIFTVPDAQPDTRGHRQAHTTRMLARAITHGRIHAPADVIPFLMAHPEAIDAGDGEAISRRWRGIAFRHESVNAWRQTWQALSEEVASRGVTTRQQMRDWFADQATADTVRSFTAALPAVVSDTGAPTLAERHEHVQALNGVLPHIAVACLGAHRLSTLHAQERLGFEGGPGTPTWALEEELSPRWVLRRIETWGDRPMADFMAALSDVLIDRAQRLSLQKARFDRKRGQVVIPGRIHTRDDLVYRVYAEQARPPALRLPQLMSMCHQVGLFDSPLSDPPAKPTTDARPVWRLTDAGASLV